MDLGCHLPEPWERIHRETFVYEDNCWTTCNGGFCCNHEHPDFQFQLIPRHGSTILYMEEEYNWLCKHGTAPNVHNLGSMPNTLSFDFGGPRPLNLIQVHCRLLGKCNGVIDKPLLCKIYPMLPVLGTDGALEDIYPSSIFELTMQIKGYKTPCTVVDKKKHYFAKWKNAPARLESLRHPYVILYLRAAKHFADVYTERLTANSALMALSGAEFWKRWELNYLAGRLLDTDQLAERIRETFNSLMTRYGTFLQAA